MALNESIQLERDIHIASASPKHTTGSSPRILRTFITMIPHIRMDQETMYNINPSDRKIPMDTIKVISETAHDQLVDSRDTTHEAQIDSEIVHAIVTTDQAQLVVLASEIDVHDGIISI